MSALRDKIMSTPGYSRETVHVPTWDVDVEVRSLSVNDMLRVKKALADGSGAEEIDGMILAALTGCYDPETGQRLFADSDEQWLRDQDFGAVQLVATKVIGLASGSPDLKESS